MAKFFITGGAGFIGSHFVDTALSKAHEVVCYDSMETGNEFFLKDAHQSKSFQFVKGDIRDLEQLKSASLAAKPDWVIHFAANADVRRGLDQPRKDLDFNTIGTWSVVEAARLAGVKNVLFSSTGSVYGEPEVFPTPEVCPFPIQTSLYGASKMAGEGLLAAYSHGYQMNCIVFRFVSILGPRYTHGHIFDFMKKLAKNPNELPVLGNGKQLKSYLHSEDLMRGIWAVIDSKPKGFEVFNIGHDDAITVDMSIGYIASELKLNPKLIYSGGERGWIGDNPRIQLDCRKLKRLGWTYENSLEKGVRDTVKYLDQHRFLFGEDYA